MRESVTSLAVTVLLGLGVLAGPCLAADREAPDRPSPRSPTDRVTHFRLWAMHQVTPKYPPYAFAVLEPDRPPETGPACLGRLRLAFAEGKRPEEAEHQQLVSLMQWLSVRPDPPPDFGKWIGCWPAGRPYYQAWEMHSSTTRRDDGPAYWYRPWVSRPESMAGATCLGLVRQMTGRRLVDLSSWYDVRPDPPPDFAKRIGCLPVGVDPEDRGD